MLILLSQRELGKKNLLEAIVPTLPEMCISI